MRLAFRDYAPIYWGADQLEMECGRLIRDVLPPVMKPVKGDPKLRARRSRKATEIVYCACLCRAMADELRRRKTATYGELHEKHRDRARHEADAKHRRIVERRMVPTDLIAHNAKEH